MFSCVSLKMDAKFNTAKINDIISNLQEALEIKINKISGFEIDRVLKELKELEEKAVVCAEELQSFDPTMIKMQKLFSKTTGKLHVLSEDQPPQIIIPQQKPTST